MNSRMGRMGKRGNEQKPKDVKYSIKRLWQYLYKFKGWLLLAFLLTIFFARLGASFINTVSILLISPLTVSIVPISIYGKTSTKMDL